MQGTGQTAAFAAAGLLGVVMTATPRAAAGNGSSSVTPVPVGPTHAYSVAVAPGASCSIHPEGVTNDPSRNTTLIAPSDGKVRFDIAPAAAAAWGTKLTLDCVLSNASQSHLVDLNDASTFTLESANDLKPVKTGVRPPLTGGPTALTVSQLVQGHYPLRPDASSPLYAKWLQRVSTSVDMYEVVMVTVLGLRMSAPYQGAWVGVDWPWAGFVQDPSGFSIDPNTDFPWANGSFLSQNLFGGYEALASGPSPHGCFTGQICDESGFWVGTGGAWVGNGSNNFAPALLQSGFTVVNGGLQVALFDEYAPNDINQGQLPSFDSDDLIFLEGYDGDANCNYTTSTPTNGCFLFEDWSGAGWTFQDIPRPFPTTDPMTGKSVAWLPATAEYISEWHPGSTNDDVTGQYIEGGALDLD
jgi:hypothetical protein